MSLYLKVKNKTIIGLKSASGLVVSQPEGC